MAATEDAIARSVARRLAGEGHPNLPVEVEGALATGSPARPEAYLDPVTGIALANFVVTVAGLAWTVYRDLKRDKQRPAPQVVERKVRLELTSRHGRATTAEQDRVVTLTVEEVHALDADAG